MASARKYFSGVQVKHNDKEVATAASSLRTRWMNALAGGGSGGSSSGDRKTAPPPLLDRTPSRSRTESDSAQQQGSSKKQKAGEETPRSRSPKPETGVAREGGGREPKRENGGKGGSPRGSSGGGRYGGGGGVREEGSAAGEGAAVKKEIKKEVKKEAKKEVAPAAAVPAAPASAKMSTEVAKDEVSLASGRSGAVLTSSACRGESFVFARCVRSVLRRVATEQRRENHTAGAARRFWVSERGIPVLFCACLHNFGFRRVCSGWA